MAENKKLASTTKTKTTAVSGGNSPFSIAPTYCNAIHSASQGDVIRLAFGEAGSDGRHWHVAISLHANVARGLLESLTEFVEEQAKEDFGELVTEKN